MIRTFDLPLTKNQAMYDELMHINRKICLQIEGYAELQDNWDQDGAPRPSDKCIADAVSFCKELSKLKQKAYFTAPGPEGEILVELQTKSKKGHIEFLFYPDETIFVKVLDRYAEQGVYNSDLLPDLLNWLKKN